MTQKVVLSSVVTTLNEIRETASNAYQAVVPFATLTNFTDVGTAVLTGPEEVQNEFINAVNKIARTVVDAMVFKNPLTGLVKGKLEYGMTIEHLYVEMIKAIPYVSGTRTGDDIPNQYEIFKPQNQAAYYQVMFERQYPVTRFDYDTRRAFRSPEGLEQYIMKVAQALYTSEQYDDYRLQVGLMARQIDALDDVTNTKHKGQVHLVTEWNALQLKKDETYKEQDVDVLLTDRDFLNYCVAQLKIWSKRLTKPRSDMNFAGVTNVLSEESSELMILDDFQEYITRFLYPNTLNEEYLKVGDVVGIDAWYSIGAGAKVSGEVVVTPDSIDIKSQVSSTGSAVAVLYDRNMYQIYNQTRWTKQAENARGGYTNTFTTVRDLYAMSPYSNFVAFILD